MIIGLLNIKLTQHPAIVASQHRVNGFVLSRLMIKAKETGLTEGLFVGRDRIRESLLQFADDTIFFSKASLEHLQNLKIILLVFGQVSGLKINLEKTPFQVLIQGRSCCLFWPRFLIVECQSDLCRI